MALIKRPFLGLILASIWMVLQDNYSLSTFVAGFIVAALVLLIFPGPVVQLHPPRFKGMGSFIRWLGRLSWMLGYFGVELCKSNIAVLKLALARKVSLTPGVLAMQLRAQQPAQIAVLAAMITLTPGTITMGVSREYGVMYIHAIDASDKEEALRVPRRFEEMIMEVIPS